MNGTIFVIIIKYYAACNTFLPANTRCSKFKWTPPIGSVAYDGCSFHLDLMSGGYSLHSICLIQLSQCIILTSPTTIPYSMLRI